jgi:hypothetical protein
MRFGPMGGTLGARRRALLALAALPVAAACAADPSVPWLGGVGDPVRGAALTAPRNLGDTSRWKGDPAGAALAAAQLEFLTDQFAVNPRYGPVVNPSVLQQLQAARAEMRDYLGIAQAAPPGAVIQALLRAAEAMRSGSPAQAEAALSGPDFTAGPFVTLARLSDMPRLPRTRNAAGSAAAEIDRLSQRRA